MRRKRPLNVGFASPWAFSRGNRGREWLRLVKRAKLQGEGIRTPEGKRSAPQKAVFPNPLRPSSEPAHIRLDSSLLNPSSSTLACTGSKQVLRTLKRALRDQSDGLARAQAVWSLFLSENYLQSSTGSSILPSVKKYLETRKAFRLDADERSAPRNQRQNTDSTRGEKSVSCKARRQELNSE